MKRTTLLPVVVWTLTSVAAWANEIDERFYDGLDQGKVSGVVGQAGVLRAFDPRGIVNMERGTIAFFLRVAKPPQIARWARHAGMNTQRGGGYWEMLLGFEQRWDESFFSFYDIGRYCPPLRMPSTLDRWKTDEWHHLATVWDRAEGIRVYEDGQLAAENWGTYQWNWNLIPQRLFFNGVVDEVYVYAVPLTSEQVAQLSRGEKPTGPPIPVTTDDKRREYDLQRMGWRGDSLAALPNVMTSEVTEITFARITGCEAAKRPLATPFEGFSRTTWPDIKYGASTKGEALRIMLASGSQYDRVRFFYHRPFQGQLRIESNGQPGHVLAQATSDASGYRALRLPDMQQSDTLILERTTGMLGQIDFFRANSIPQVPPQPELISYSFVQTNALPATETGKTLAIETPLRFQNPVRGALDAEATWTLDTPAFGGFQGITDSPEKALAYDGVLCELVVSGVSRPTPVRIQVKEPVHGARDWLVGDVVLQPAGKGPQTYRIMLKGRPIINMPPVETFEGRGKNRKAVTVPGPGFGISVTAADAVQWHMGANGTRFRFYTIPRDKALPAAADDQIEFMREGYAELMEGHDYRDSRIITPIKWLALFAPERVETQQMYERVGSPEWFEGIDVPKLVYAPPANETGAPDWAFWQMQVMAEHRKIIDYYIDEKQIHTGEYGGIWNDDTTHMENWLGYALCMDDSGKIKASLHKFWDGLWQHQLREGVGKYVQDACHFYEEGMGSMGMRLLVDYGDPTAYARAMAASSHYDKWMRDDGNGGLEWISEYIGPNEVWTEGIFETTGGRGGHKGNLLVPGGYLIWYNQHPRLAEIFRRYKQGSEPGATGFEGAAYNRVTDLAASRKALAALATTITQRPNKEFQMAQQVNRLVDEVGMTGAIRAAHGSAYKPLDPIRHYPAYYDTEIHWFRYRMSGDIRWLVDSYQRVCEWFHSHDWLNSRAQPSMDRNPLPRLTLIYARMGAPVSNRGSSNLMWPRHGLSYVKGANDVATLVTRNTDTGLAARFYAFTDARHDLQLRVWRLNPGKYRVVLSSDPDDDGRPDAVLSEQTVQLRRGASLDLALPPRQPVVLHTEPIEVHEPNFDRPDPAIGPDTVEVVYDDHLVVRVFNNGTQPAENVLVRVRDGASGKILPRGEQRIARIEAPLDLHPRSAAIEVKNISPHVLNSIIVEVDPEHEIDDLNPFNNVVKITY